MKIRILEQHHVVRYDYQFVIEGEGGKPVTIQQSRTVPPGSVVDVPSDLAISLISGRFAEEAGESEKITMQAYPDGWKDPTSSDEFNDVPPTKKRRG
jgi:hypothetical protein